MGPVGGRCPLRLRASTARVCRVEVRVGAGMRIPKHTPSGTQVARAHGLFNILSGAWPLLHMRSFQAVM